MGMKVQKRGRSVVNHDKCDKHKCLIQGYSSYTHTHNIYTHHHSAYENILVDNLYLFAYTHFYFSMTQKHT